MEVNTDIGKLWENRYITELAIKDHIHELMAIDDEIKRRKNAEPGKINVNLLKSHYLSELADLALLILNYVPEDLIEKRRLKFLEKQGKNG